jgi:D-alanyl-D-alanine carboxypeptidase
MMSMSALVMQARLRRCGALVGLVLASCLSACAWVPQQQADGLRHAALKKALAQIAASVDLSESAGYALRISSRGQMLFAKDAGLASSDGHMPIDGQTIFELASLSKSFTALAVMQLQEQGLIDLELSLSRYLPDMPKAWEAISVHHLLSHQSGVPDWLNRWPRSRLHEMDFRALMQQLAEQPQLDFEPGSQAVYSNTNYVLLAQLVEEVSGLAFADYLQEHVFGPADMSASSVLVLAPEQLIQQALSYAEAGKIHGIDYALVGAISQKSPMQDLQNFMKALLSHRLIKSETLDLMMTPHAVLEDGKRYGYGWYIGQFGGWASMTTTGPAAGVGHTGRLGAYRSALYFNRPRDFQFIMLSNGGAFTEMLLVRFLKKTRDALE